MVSQQRIDLHCPRGWNQCTTWELEQIAAAMLLETMQADRYHPFDLLKVKLKAFLAINRLEVISEGEEVSARLCRLACPRKSEGEGFLVRFVPAKRKWWQRLFSPSHPLTFSLSPAHIHAIISEHFTWLDDDKADPLMRPPYEPITPMLDGYVWHEYRLMQDWMDVYVKANNRLATMRHNHPLYNKVRAEVLNARNNFLAILLKENELTSHSLTLSPSHSLTLSPSNDIKWQVILFWWSGLMRTLMKKYPRCFKQTKPGKRQKPSNPLDFYTSIIATMQTKTHLSEETIDKHTSYQVILEQLERLAKESEEMEKISRKNKH